MNRIPPSSTKKKSIITTGGTKRFRDVIVPCQNTIRSKVSATNMAGGEQNQREVNLSKSQSTTGAEIPKHSSRTRKRIKLSRLRENRHIHKAVAAMEEQLASFEKIAQNPDSTSTSFSASSSFFFSVGSNSREDSGKDDISRSTNKDCSASEEYELTALASSLRLEESSSSSTSSGRKPRPRRRGAISIVMARR